MKRFLAAAALLCLISAEGNAASKGGEYAVKDAGRATCARYVEVREEKAQAYFLYVGWISGYLSAYNRFAEDTVDIVPWQSTDLLAVFVDNHCKKNPQLPFAKAVDALIAALAPMRLRGASDMIQVNSGDQSISVYKEIVRRTQQTLTERGVYKGALDGVYGEGTRKAIEDFQRERNIPVTGLPDQATLFELFR